MDNLNYRTKKIIYKERDDQGNVLRQPVKKDIFIFFKQSVPAGHSTFEVPISRNHLHRRFSFDELYLVPVLYSDQASAFDLDTDEQLDEIITYDIYMKINFDPRNRFYPDTYLGLPGTKATWKLCNDMNLFFEYKKPYGILHLATFFDWIDLRYDPAGDEKFDEFMQKMALVYYGEIYDPVKHYNALPPSARTIYGVNNYLFPTELTEDNLNNIRLRLNIAPNTNVNVSTNGHLREMGFSDDQIGDRNMTNRNFIFDNEETTQFGHITADFPIKETLTYKPVDFRVYCQIIRNHFFSEAVKVSITRRNSFRNENYETAVKDALDNLAQQCNIIFNVSYNPKVKKFTFTFPINVNMRDQTIFLVPELSERLGFAQVTDVAEGNKTGERVDDSPDPKETQDKARALAYDTSVVIVSSLSQSDNNTIISGADYMASLFPTETGSMEMRFNQFGLEPPSMIMPTFATSLPTISTTFSLSTFLDNNTLTDLKWKDGAFIIGILRGVDAV
jgi:hypothetical protein